jgi:hypothetical protein
MKNAIPVIIGLLLAGATVGCADVPADNEAVAETHEALYYSHVWNVYSLDNGVRHDYYSPNDMTELNGLGFPVQMWDSGSNPSVNSGTICALLPSTTAGGSPAWSCFTSNNFSGANYVHTNGGLSNYPKDVQVTKPINSGNWKAQWGTGGPGYSYIYYASYGQ